MKLKDLLKLCRLDCSINITCLHLDNVFSFTISADNFQLFIKDELLDLYVDDITAYEDELRVYCTEVKSYE